MYILQDTSSKRYTDITSIVAVVCVAENTLKTNADFSVYRHASLSLYLTFPSLYNFFVG